MKGRLIGIDHGLKRLGVAISDANHIVARELCIIERTSKAQDFARLNAIVQAEQAVAIVVGMPFSDVPDGIYTQADKVKLWMKRFQETTPLSLIAWDESLTSDDARMLAHQLGRKSTDPIDDLAARLILQSYLDALHDGLETLPHPTT